jgi:hypothetical protein
VARGRRARIGIDENLTPKQLENKCKVKDEIKLKNGREGDGNHVYKLVGSDGNYKSVRVRKLKPKTRNTTVELQLSNLKPTSY